MKKIFSFCAAMLMALVANATVWEITPTSPREKDNIRYCLRDNAQAGDTILLTQSADYGESDAITIDKSVVIMAAEGVNPVVKPTYYTKWSNGANAKIIGLKFDGQGTCEYALRPYDNSASSMILEDCEFTNFVKNVITAEGDKHTDSLIINNCYFHDNGRAAVYFAASTAADGSHICDYLKVTNTTIANISALSGAGAIDVRSNGSAEGDYNRLFVDHVTIYNVAGYERGIQSYKSTAVSITNSIIVEPADKADYLYPTYCYGGTISNILTYNTKNHRSGPTISGLIENTDPLFADAANGDYTLGAGSPALGAGTDGSNLGDPRWWPAAPVAGCDWDNIEWLGTSDVTYANQFKLCQADGEHPGVVNIQQPGFATEIGIYVTFPSAAFGAISLDASQYDLQGAGMILHLSAFTALETEVSVVCESKEYIFTVYNAKGGSASNVITDITLNVTVPVVGEVLKNMVFPTDPVWATYASLVTLPDGVNYELMRFQVYLGDGNYAEDGVFEPNTAYRFDVAVQPKEGYEFPMNDNTSIKLDELNLTVNQNGEGYNMYNGWGYFGIIVNFTTGTATAIENNAVVEKTVKFIENGQLFIEKNGVPVVKFTIIPKYPQPLYML